MTSQFMTDLSPQIRQQWLGAFQTRLGKSAPGEGRATLCNHCCIQLPSLWKGSSKSTSVATKHHKNPLLGSWKNLAPQRWANWEPFLKDFYSLINLVEGWGTRDVKLNVILSEAKLFLVYNTLNTINAFQPISFCHTVLLRCVISHGGELRV